VAMHKKAIRWLCVLLAAVLLCTDVPVQTVSAQSSSEIRKQIEKLEQQEQALRDQMASIEDQMQENVTQLLDVVAQKQRLDRQISLLHAQVENINSQLAALNLLIADAQEEVEAAQQRHAQLNEKYKDRIRAMEEEGTVSYWSALFKANSIADFLDRLNMIQEIAAADQRRLEELRAAALEVEQAQQALEAEKINLDETARELEQTQQELEEKRTGSDALMQELLQRGEEFEQLLDQAERDQDALMQQIAQREEDYDVQKYLEWLATSEPETTQPEPTEPEPTEPEPTEPEPTEPEPTEPEPTEPEPTEPVEPEEIEWLTPVPYYVLTSPFGMRFHPILQIWRMHNGVDLACAEGTPIYATRSGVVTIAEEGATAGFYVQINHGDGYRSVYMHMTHYIVSVGDYVSAGQVIGYVGSTGLSDGNHLHFGISYNGTYVNPMEYIG